MIAHDEVFSVGHLIRKIDVGITQGTLRQIGLRQHSVVDIYRAVILNVHPFARERDDAFDQDFVIIVKGDDIAPIHLARFHGAALTLDGL